MSANFPQDSTLPMDSSRATISFSKSSLNLSGTSGIIFLINFVYKDGPDPYSFEAADVNSDGEINILDIICYIYDLYKNMNCFNCTWPE